MSGMYESASPHSPPLPQTELLSAHRTRKLKLKLKIQCILSELVRVRTPGGPNRLMLDAGRLAALLRQQPHLLHNRIEEGLNLSK